MLKSLENRRLNTLAKKMQKGDRLAAEKVFDHFNSLIFRFFVSRLLNKDVAEDLSQDVFLKIVSRIETYREDLGNFSAWIWQIAKNRLTDYYREKKPLPIVDFLAENQNLTTDGRQIINDRLEVGNILKIVQNFAPEEQEIFSLHYVADLPYQAIGEITGKSVGSLRITIHRLNNKIKRAVKK